MSTGISISSINRIKELAEEKKYAEALEILDTQNLDKSINPQFLRISGEIFRENKRYYDSRRILLKSHEMSPEGTRIIAELIQLYLELGYFTRAKKYYDQYLFYSSDDDSQRDYVEYMYKKATGCDVSELASILIPILESMPDDKWNFEAVLLYDKLDRKDKALEEARYILEQFKDSKYISQVIEYIDDKLDVDQYFYIYPREEVEEDKELFGDLIEKEEKILLADHYRMFPPEAKIIVEAEDKDAIDNKPAKEKKNKKKQNASSASVSKEEEEKISSIEPTVVTVSSDNKSDAESEAEEAFKEQSIIEEQAKKKDREAALNKILSKTRNLDKAAIKESAKQVVKNVGHDTKKATNQVKKVTETVFDNVSKATDTLSNAVGTNKVSTVSEGVNEEFVDGIIEDVIETPKKAVGEVVTNEELDALVPDSLEAMTSDEVAGIEARKEEQERAELEELEASIKSEEARKTRKRRRKSEDINEELADDISGLKEDAVVVSEAMQSEVIASVSFKELKEKFLAENDEKPEEEDEPLDSLGFISVVQSDVDEFMENETPETAEILHRMIDNREYYTGEDSRGFESKASYENHGFEVEDYEFNEYLTEHEEPKTEQTEERVYKVEEIYTDNSIEEFDVFTSETEDTFEDRHEEAFKNTVEEPAAEPIEVSVEESVEEPAAEPIEVSVEESVEEPATESIEEIYETPTEQTYQAPIEEVYEEPVAEQVKEPINTDIYNNRDILRFRIILTENMVKGLLDLKESR